MEIATPSETLRLLSSMFLCKPTREIIESWKSAIEADSSLFLADLQDAIHEIDTSSDQVMEDLLWEFTRLFIGPYKLPCPPWESVYTSPKRLMMQESAAQVRELYEQAGLSLGTDDVMPDHIGAELNFLAVLLDRRQGGGEQTEALTVILENLLHDHLLQWTPKFIRDMENAAETGFYKTLARTTRTTLEIFGR